MSRYITPALFAAMSAWMWHYNDTHSSSKLLLPFADALFPEHATNPTMLAERSFQGAVVITALATAWSLISHLRSIRRRRLAQRDLG